MVQTLGGVPIPVIIQQQQMWAAAEAEQQQLHTAFLLLLEKADVPLMTWPHRETQERNQMFATFVVGRVKFDAVIVPVEGKDVELTGEEAKAYYVEHVEGPNLRAHQEQQNKVKGQRENLARKATIEESVEIKRSTGGLLREKVVVDIVRIGNDVSEVDAQGLGKVAAGTH